jgi:hypothetical protein
MYYRVHYPDGRQEGPSSWEQLKQQAFYKTLPPAAILENVQTGERQPVHSTPDLMQLAQASVSSGSSALIPLDNKPALLSYYLGLFSLAACIPFVGLLGVGMAITAFVLGIKGLKLVKAHPEVHGTVHAWIGVLGGLICGTVGLLVNVVVIIALLANP